ncbi:proton-conducting transporter membrane subunit [Aestuariivirga sp.]|uniref:proton-conducting transporter transmembrane domain-containing protein n=1 Tax=Aestuariivirga sp. TaxID=2650926 RepID=UPI00391A359F
MSLLLALMLGLPLVMALLLAVRPFQNHVVRLLALAPLPGLLLALAGGGAPWAARLPGGWSFELDRPAAMMLAASALIWSAAGACAARWLKTEAGTPRFALWWLITLWGSLGVFAAADLAGFYLLYAAASLPAYGMIVWAGGAAERRAGRLTLAAALLGEALILAAFVLIAAGAPGQSILIRDGVAALAASPFRDAVIALLILGFGLKIGLVPLHGWMPLSYAAGPLFAAAALSGATSKAGIIGLIRFLPFDAAHPQWGMVLLAAGLVSAFYGVAVGLFQTNARSVLAYSSISQLGQMAAALGAGLAVGDAGAAVLVAFYALYHVLTKGGLFLAMDALAEVDRGPRRTVIMATAAIAAMGFAGLPLAGGAMAKLALKPLIGEGAAGLLFTAAAFGSALLMFHFIRLIGTIEARRGSGAGSSLSAAAWLFVFGLAMLLPWLLFSDATGLAASYALKPGILLDLGWPVAAGLLIGWGALAAGLLAAGPAQGEDRTRSDMLAKLWDMLDRAAPASVERLIRLEASSRQWATSASLLVLVMLALAVLLQQ